jgi:predicted MFS family arabinose efflux permease
MGAADHAAGRAAVRRLAASRAASASGGIAAYTALSYAVYARTGASGWVAAAVLATFGVAGFVSPLAGLAADRLDRRRLLIGSDLAAMAAALAMAAVDDVPALVLLALVGSICETPFFPASSAAVARLVDDAALPWANGLIAAGRAVGTLTGPVVAGVLLGALDARAVFLANAVSFALSAALVASIRGDLGPPRGAVVAGGQLRELAAGYRFLARDRVVAVVVAGEVGLLGSMGAGVTTDAPFVRTALHAGPLVYAALIASWGVGQVAAGAGARRLRLGSTVRADLGVFAVAIAAVASCWLLSAALPVVAVVLAVQLLGGGGAAAAFAIRQTLLQRRSPPALAGRVFAAADTLLDAGQLGGVVLAGVAADALGARASYGLAGGLAVAGAAAVALGALSPAAAPAGRARWWRRSGRR